MDYLFLPSAPCLLPYSISATEGSVSGQRTLSPIAREAVTLEKKLQTFKNYENFAIAFGALEQSPNQFTQVIALRDFSKTKETYCFCLYLVVLETWYSPVSTSDDSTRATSKAGW